VSGVVCVVCPFADDEKLKNIHVDLALLVWSPALLSTHAPLPPLKPHPPPSFLYLFIFPFFPFPDCSQLFSGCTFRCTCLFQAAHFFGPIILYRPFACFCKAYCLACPLEKRTFSCHLRTLLCHSSTLITFIRHWKISDINMSFKNIIMSFKHLYNIHMTLKDFDSRCTLLATESNHNDHLKHNRLMCCVWCSNQMHNPGIVGLPPRGPGVEIAEPWAPGVYLKTSRMDWLNYFVSGLWWKSSQLKIQITILKMGAESCSVRCRQ